MSRLVRRLISTITLVTTVSAVLGGTAGVHAAEQPRAAACGLPRPAFCDTFETPYQGGGRTGQLDPSRWVVSRASSDVNPSQGVLNRWAPTNAMHCRMPMSNVLPPNDFFLCGLEFGEPEHFMEAVDDGGARLYNGAMILQPFDFADRSGTITFDVDAKTAGSHTWWVELMVSEEPIVGAYDSDPNQPRNAFGIEFHSDCQQPGNLGAVGNIHIITNYNDVAVLPGTSTGAVTLSPSQCYATIDDVKNHFQVSLSQQHMEVWATDANGAHLRKVSSADNLKLPFTRGYVHLQHAQYNAAKEGVAPNQTYHWGDVGFDGPVLAPLAAYQVADSLARPGGNLTGLNLAYRVDTSGTSTGANNTSGPLSLGSVTLTGATAASLAFGWWTMDDVPLEYRFNDGPWHTFTRPWPTLATAWRPGIVNVPLDELHSATNNTVEFKTRQVTSVSNVTLYIDGAALPTTLTQKTPPDTVQSPQPSHTMADGSTMDMGHAMLHLDGAPGDTTTTDALPGPPAQPAE